jgi:hypothetical protein
MRHPNRITTAFSAALVAVSAASYCPAQTRAPGKPAGEQRRFLNTVAARVRAKISSEETRLRNESAAAARTQQSAKAALKLRAAELERAQQAQWEAKRQEDDSRGSLFYRSDPLFKQVAFEANRDRRAQQLRSEAAKSEAQALQAAADAADAELVRLRAALESVQRLAEQQAEAEARLRQWESNPTPELYAEVSQALVEMALAAKVRSSVRFVSVDRDGRVNPGATVKFQSEKQRLYESPPATAKCLTSCTDELTLEVRYFIWTERGGRRTSDMDKSVLICNEQEEVILIEDQFE